MLPNEEKGEGVISIGFSTKMADSRSRHQELVERSSPKHLQPKEGRKEPAPAPRAIADIGNKRYGDEVRGSIPTMAPCHGSPVD